MSAHRRHRIALLSFLALLALPGAALAAPVTIVTSQVPLKAVAADGANVGWIDTTCHVFLRDTRHGTQRAFGRSSDACVALPRIAVAGKRALWSDADFGNDSYWAFHGGTLASTKVATYGDEAEQQFGGDDSVNALVAGGGSTFALSIAARAESDACIDGTTPCTYVTMGAHPFRVAAGIGTRIAAVPPTFALGVGGGRGVFVPAATAVDPHAKLTAVPGGPMQVRSLVDGHLVATLTPDGTVLAVATNGTTVAVLRLTSDPHPDTHLTLLDVATGIADEDIQVASTTAPQLSMTAHSLVWRNGLQVYAMRGFDGSFLWGKVRTLPIAPIATMVEPVDPAHDRLLWASNPKVAGHRRGRVQAVPITLGG